MLLIYSIHTGLSAGRTLSNTAADAADHPAALSYGHVLGGAARPSWYAARCTAPRRAAVIVAKAELTICTGSVCSKHGTKEVQAAARKSGLAMKTTSKCLKGCGKGVNVTGKGIGKRMLKGCSDPAKAQAATDQIAKKLGL